MPRPQRRRADVLKAAAAREAARANAQSGSTTAVSASKDNDAAVDGALLMSGALQRQEDGIETSTEDASQPRIAREEVATARALESLRGTKQKAIFTPRNKTRSTRTGPVPRSTLQVQRSQSSQDASEPPRTNTRARNVPMAPMSVRKPMSTPRAEASMLALANFKRRSRAASILGIGNADDTASISSDGSFGDLMPDDESTPLPKPLVQRQLDHQLLPQDTPKGSDDDDALPPRSDSSRKRKRGSAEIQVPFSQSTDGVTTRRSTAKSYVEVSSGEEVSSDEVLPEVVGDQRPSTPSMPSSIMAPPASSSPIKDSQDKADVPSSPPSPSNGRKTKSKSASGPGIAKDWANKRAGKAQKPLNTAALQQLLPRRRQIVQDEDFDIYSSDEAAEGSGADELSSAPSKRRRGAVSNKKQRAALAERAAPAKPVRKSTRKAKAAPSKGKESGRTYSRRSADEENATDSDGSTSDKGEADADYSVETSFSALLENPSVELKSAVRKFAEVDEWQMEYEDGPASSNSILADAR